MGTMTSPRARTINLEYGRQISSKAMSTEESEAVKQTIQLEMLDRSVQEDE